MSETYYAWHWHNGFVAERRRASGRKAPHAGVPIAAGQILTVRGKIIPCENGLHASKRALDALQYAPGPFVSRVILSGTIVEEGDKAAAAQREVLWVADATRTLHEFAVWCAKQALLREREAGREPDPRSWNALEVKLRWLAGEATDEELHAAREAAWGAAWEAAREAAWGAAAGAAWEAAREAAWGAAAGAAWGAAWGAQNAELERRLMPLAPTDVVEVTP